MNLDERRERLATAGIELIRPWPPTDAAITPVDVAWGASACGPESGRVDRAFDDDDPDQVGKGNAAWLELARRFRLFDQEGAFLLSVVTGSEDDAPAQWFLAALRDGREPDLFGAGARDGVLGFRWGVPAFVMHSTDGEVLIAASWYESSFSVFAIPHPRESPVLRQAACQWLARPDRPPPAREAARKWLDAFKCR